MKPARSIATVLFTDIVASTEKASTLASLVEHWRNPDPELRPFVEQARQGMIQAGGLRRE